MMKPTPKKVKIIAFPFVPHGHRNPVSCANQIKCGQVEVFFLALEFLYFEYREKLIIEQTGTKEMNNCLQKLQVINDDWSFCCSHPTAVI